MKLIHCADLHLDSPLGTNLTGQKARLRAKELRHTLTRMVQFARDEGVRAILIAGDLFDSESVRESTKSFFLDTVRAYPEILFFYLAGNHDRGARLSGELPQNLRLFSDGWTSYSLGEVTVTGSENPDEETLSLDPARCNVLLLHGQERAGGGRREADVIRMGLLRGKGIDYLALGHIHRYRETLLDARGVAVYSGCPEGRGFDECGECGFAARRLHAVSVDVEGIDSVPLLEARVNAAVAEIAETDLCKVILTGRRERRLLTDPQAIALSLQDRFFSVTVRDESRWEIRPSEAANDVSLRGAFLREVLAAEMSEQMRERVIAYGLTALSGEEL